MDNPTVLGAGTPNPRWCATGIDGFDEISGGGVPCGKITLVMGGPGSGKTTFALQMLAHGIVVDGEPGVFVSCEEPVDQIQINAGGFGWGATVASGDRIAFVDARLDADIEVSGTFDLTGLMARIEHEAQRIGARRVVIDSLDALLGLLDTPSVERRELRRLCRWLAESGLTGIITAKSDPEGSANPGHYDVLQFAVDCVVVLSHRLQERVSDRSLRIDKLRGSGFAENEFPMVIDGTGLNVASRDLRPLIYDAPDERVSTGVARLDAMLGGGYHRASSVLISGAPGTAKTTLCGSFVAAACARGERTLFVSLDEAADQIQRNLASVGIDLGKYVADETLRIIGIRVALTGVESHVRHLKQLLREVQPRCLVIDPLSALIRNEDPTLNNDAVVRLLDAAKEAGVTTVCTSVPNQVDPSFEATPMGVSAIADVWIHLSYAVIGAERNRALTIVKARGTAHSNQVRELVLGDDGVTLADVYSAGGEVLMGTARWQKQVALAAAEEQGHRDIARRAEEAALAEAEIRARIATLERELALRKSDRLLANSEQAQREQTRDKRAAELHSLRGGDSDVNGRAEPSDRGAQ